MRISAWGLVCLFHLSLCQVITVLTLQDAVELKANEIMSREAFPSVQLDNIRVKQLDDETSKYSTLCRIKPARLQTQKNSLVVFQDKSQKQSLKYQLQQLKNLKNALDLAEFKGYYFVAFKQGRVDVYDIEEDDALEKVKSIINGEPLPEGYFTKNQDTLLYISPSEFLQVNSTNLLSIPFQPIPNLSNAKIFDYGDIFISTDNGGIYYMNFNHRTYELVNRTFLNLTQILGKFIQIQDFAFDAKLNLLMVVDLSKGVYFFDFKNLALTLNTKHFVNKVGCQNIWYLNKILYLTCPQLVRYSLESFEMEMRPASIYPQWLILTPSHAIVLVGSTHIAYYKRWESTPILHEVIEETKLFFDGSKLVYMNDYELVEETIQVIPEVLICEAGNHPSGVYTIVLSGDGDCDLDYLMKHDVQLVVRENDTCSYEARALVEVWQPHNIKWMFIWMGAVAAASLFFILCLCCCLKRMKLKKQYSDLIELKTFENETEAGQSVPTQSFILDFSGREISTETSHI